jgi:hypothetical protein
MTLAQYEARVVAAVREWSAARKAVAAEAPAAIAATERLAAAEAAVIAAVHDLEDASSLYAGD